MTTMNNPRLVFLPYYSPTWERVSLRNASRYVRVRLEEAGSAFVDDIATRFVATEFYLYQPNLGMFASVKLYAEIISGGSWLPRSSVSFFRVWTRADKGKGIYAVVFFAVVVLQFARFAFGTLRRRYHQASRRLMNAVLLCNLWDWLDTAVFVLLLVSGSFRVAYLVRCTQLNINLPKLTYAARYPAELDSVLGYTRVQVYVNAVIVVLMFINTARCIAEFFAPLVFLSRVLFAARATLVGVSLLFLLVLLTFAMAGHVLLGQSVAEFRTVNRSYHFFFFLLLRQVNVESVLRQAARRTEVILFLWSFVAVEGLCVFSGVVGILSAALQVVSADAKLSIRAVSSSSGDAGSRSGARRQFYHPLVPLSVRWILSRYVLGTLLHPRRYRTAFVHLRGGRGRAALLHRALRALHSYRRLCYSMHTTLSDVDKDVITEEQFMRAVLFPCCDDVCPPQCDDKAAAAVAAVASAKGEKHFAPLREEIVAKKSRRQNPLSAGAEAAAATTSTTDDDDDNDDDGHGDGGDADAAKSGNADASDPFVVFFYEEVWAHLCEEWATSMTSKEAVEMQRRVMWAAAAAEKVVSGQMDILQRLPGRLASLEASVTQFTKMLNEVHAISA